MPYWDERVEAMAKNYPGRQVDKYHIDILTAHFVRNPTGSTSSSRSNLFGDILSDLGPACTGTIGIAPSGNINPERKFPSLFEPVHGSAPDIAGQGIANPIGQIWSRRHDARASRRAEAAAAIVKAIEQVLAEPKLRTPDLGGAADTVACGKAVAERAGAVFRDMIHEQAQRAEHFFAGRPFLAGDDQQRAEAAGGFVEVAQLFRHPVRIAEIIDAGLGELVEGRPRRP